MCEVVILLLAAHKMATGAVDRWNRLRDADLERDLTAAVAEQERAVVAGTEQTPWAQLRLRITCRREAYEPWHVQRDVAPPPDGWPMPGRP